MMTGGQIRKAFYEAPSVLITTAVFQKAPSGLFDHVGDEGSNGGRGVDVRRGSEQRLLRLSGIIHLFGWPIALISE